jgi:hypothetical protein
MEAGSAACSKPVAAGDRTMPCRYQMGRKLHQGTSIMSPTRPDILAGHTIAVHARRLISCSQAKTGATSALSSHGDTWHHVEGQ